MNDISCDGTLAQSALCKVCLIAKRVMYCSSSGIHPYTPRSGIASLARKYLALLTRIFWHRHTEVPGFANRFPSAGDATTKHRIRRGPVSLAYIVGLAVLVAPIYGLVVLPRSIVEA